MSQEAASSWSRENLLEVSGMDSCLSDFRGILESSRMKVGNTGVESCRPAGGRGLMVVGTRSLRTGTSKPVVRLQSTKVGGKPISYEISEASIAVSTRRRHLLCYMRDSRQRGRVLLGGRNSRLGDLKLGNQRNSRGVAEVEAQ